MPESEFGDLASGGQSRVESVVGIEGGGLAIRRLVRCEPGDPLYPESLLSEADHTIECVHEAGHVVAAWCVALPLHPEHAVRRCVSGGDDPIVGSVKKVMGTDTAEAIECWVGSRPRQAMNFFLAGAAAADALVLHPDSFPGIERPAYDAAIDEDLALLNKAWRQVNDGALSAEFGFPSDDEFLEFIDKDWMRRLEEWALVHAGSIERVSQLIWGRLGESLSSLPGESDCVEVITTAEIGAVLGSSHCSLDNCFLKINQ